MLSRESHAVSPMKTYINVRWFLFVLSVPLLVEIIRRFFLYDDILLLVGDVICVSYAVYLVIRCGFPFKNSIVLLIGVFMAITIWALFSLLIVHQNVVLFLIGMRPLFLSILFLLIGSIARKEFGAVLIRFIHNWLFFWLAVGLVVAALQLYLGAGHPINSLPGSEVALIADYTSGRFEEGLENIFRPSSMYLHPGKFGQITFFLAISLIVFIIRGQIVGPRAFWGAMLIGACLLIAGQRAALLFLLIGSGCATALPGSKVNFAKFIYFGGALVSAITLFYIFDVPFVVASLLFDRFISVFQDVFHRLDVNLVQSYLNIFERYWLMGDGPGSYSLGSAAYGGAIIYEIDPIFADAENSWLRIMAELGLIGAVLYMFFFFLVIKACFIIFWRYRFSEEGSLPLAVVIWSSSVVFWANTHDVLGSATTLSIGFAFVGLVLYSGQESPRSRGLALDSHRIFGF